MPATSSPAMEEVPLASTSEHTTSMYAFPLPYCQKHDAASKDQVNATSRRKALHLFDLTSDIIDHIVNLLLTHSHINAVLACLRSCRALHDVALPKLYHTLYATAFPKFYYDLHATIGDITEIFTVGSGKWPAELGHSRPPNPGLAHRRCITIKPAYERSRHRGATRGIVELLRAIPRDTIWKFKWEDCVGPPGGVLGLLWRRNTGLRNLEVFTGNDDIEPIIDQARREGWEKLPFSDVKTLTVKPQDLAALRAASKILRHCEIKHLIIHGCQHRVGLDYERDLGPDVEVVHRDHTFNAPFIDSFMDTLFSHRLQIRPPLVLDPPRCFKSLHLHSCDLHTLWYHMANHMDCRYLDELWIEHCLCSEEALAYLVYFKEVPKLKDFRFVQETTGKQSRTEFVDVLESVLDHMQGRLERLVLRLRNVSRIIEPHVINLHRDTLEILVLDLRPWRGNGFPAAPHQVFTGAEESDPDEEVVELNMQPSLHVGQVEDGYRVLLEGCQKLSQLALWLPNYDLMYKEQRFPVNLQADTYGPLCLRGIVPSLRTIFTTLPTITALTILNWPANDLFLALRSSQTRASELHGFASDVFSLWRHTSPSSASNARLIGFGANEEDSTAHAFALHQVVYAEGEVLYRGTRERKAVQVRETRGWEIFELPCLDFEIERRWDLVGGGEEGIDMEE